MSTLYNIDGSQSISIYLYKDIMSNEWIRYQIVFENVRSCKSEKIIFNEETAETELFLECCIEPEIPRLLKDIYSLLEFQISSSKFEPIDEKEFSLSATHIDNKIKVELTLRYRKCDYKILMITNEKELLLFAKNLQIEYGDLVRGKHGLLKL